MKMLLTCAIGLLLIAPAAYPQETSEKTLDRYESHLQEELWQQETPAINTDQPPTLPTPYPPHSTQQFIYPTKGILTSGYGWRWGRMHKGIDIAGSIGIPIVAAAQGVVNFAGWNNGGYGNLVELRHADGSLTRYAHNSRILVSSGEFVKQGQAIAEMGSTGYSTGPHCHFEIHRIGKGAVNPLALLPGFEYQSNRNPR